MVSYYDYAELRAKAESGRQEDINNLGKWFEKYGIRYWNGEYFDADGLMVYPVYSEYEPDDYVLIGWREKNERSTK